MLNLSSTRAVGSIAGQRGATLVENVIALPLFFVVLIIGIELLRVSYVKLSLQFLLTEVARESQINPGLDAQEFRNMLTNRLSLFGVSLNPERDSISVCPITSAPCENNEVLLGARRDVMIYRVDKELDLFFLPEGAASVLTISSKSLGLTARVMGRNEPP